MLYVYIGCLTFSVIYAVMSAVLGSHGFDHGMDGHDGITGDGGVDSADVPSPFNPLVISSAIATFGAAGIIGTVGFKMDGLASSFLALTFAGIVGAAVFFGVVKLMYNSQSNSTFSQKDFIGIEAEVITPAPKQGIGEIAFTHNGVRHNLTAKSIGNEELLKGDIVSIKDVAGNIAIVGRKVTINDLDFIEFNNNEVRRNNEEKI